MTDLFVWFWIAMIFLSIAWYALMLFYVGVKGGYEVLQMTRNLSKASDDDYTVRRQQADEP